MGSDGPGSFAFATHNECDALLATISKALTNEFCKGVICGGAALLVGIGIRYVVDTAIQMHKEKKEEKELFE
jgi:F0F1-type ATP synthase membrane subunit c/vacuolar-type H+-ATPase subunit K